jgi:hypothetical protein
MREILQLIMDITSGHDHDGSNSKAVNTGAPSAGVIVNSMVSDEAAIALAKLAEGTAAYVIVCNSEGVPVYVAMSGDVSIGDDGATEVSDLTMDSEAQGGIIYFNGTNWVVLPAGTSGQFLKTLGSGANPVWDSAPLSELPSGTPVNAVAASKVLTIDGVVIDGETVTLGVDVYEFCGDAAQSLTAGSTIAVDIEAAMTKSTNNLTVDTQPTAGDDMTIGSKTYTFVPDGTANADGEISVGTNLGTAQANIVAAINGTDEVNDANESASAGAFAGNISAITALVGGTAGDSIATTENFTAGTNAFSAGTLGSGADCSKGDAKTALIAAITSDDTQGVGAADGGGDDIAITNDVKGVVGNSVSIAEDMANGAFAGGATELSGGVDGTVGTERQVYADTSYIYMAVAANTIADANWRRVSLGSAY